MRREWSNGHASDEEVESRNKQTSPAPASHTMLVVITRRASVWYDRPLRHNSAAHCPHAAPPEKAGDRHREGVRPKKIQLDARLPGIRAGYARRRYILCQDVVSNGTVARKTPPTLANTGYSGESARFGTHRYISARKCAEKTQTSTRSTQVHTIPRMQASLAPIRIHRAD